jgi:hypothetical protein
MTESYLGQDEFCKFVTDEWKESDPNVLALLEEIRCHLPGHEPASER